MHGVEVGQRGKSEKELRKLERREKKKQRLRENVEEILRKERDEGKDPPGPGNAQFR